MNTPERRTEDTTVTDGAETTVGPDGGDCDHAECIAFRAAARQVAEAKLDQFQSSESMGDLARMLGIPATRVVLNASTPSAHEGLPDNYLSFELAPASDEAWSQEDGLVAKVDVQISGYLLTRAELVELHTKLGAELGL